MRDKVNIYEKLNTLQGSMNNTKLAIQTSHVKHSEENAMIVKAMGTWSLGSGAGLLKHQISTPQFNCYVTSRLKAARSSVIK